jgi:hypothetical protein
MLAVTLTIWLAMAAGTSAIASSKGRSAMGYFALGLLLPIVGLIIAVAMSDIGVGAMEDGASSPRRAQALIWLVAGALCVWTLLALMPQQ